MDLLWAAMPVHLVHQPKAQLGTKAGLHTPHQGYQPHLLTSHTRGRYSHGSQSPATLYHTTGYSAPPI